MGDADCQESGRIEFFAKKPVRKSSIGELVFVELLADWGGETNPLFDAQQDRICLEVRQDDETGALIRVVLAEAAAKRCELETVLSRLRRSYLRKADPGISRAIVAIHENPGRSWCNDDWPRLQACHSAALQMFFMPAWA